VTIEDAREYCQWLNSMLWKYDDPDCQVFLPHASLWDFAATGRECSDTDLDRYLEASLNSVWHGEDRLPSARVLGKFAPTYAAQIP